MVIRPMEARGVMVLRPSKARGFWVFYPFDCKGVVLSITPPGVLQGKAGRSRGHCTVHSHMALGKLTFTEESPGGGSGEVSI